MTDTFELCGDAGLSVDDVLRCARSSNIEIKIAAAGEGYARLQRSAKYIEEAVALGAQNMNHECPLERRRHLIYGVTTGFGHNKNKPLKSLEAARQLQRNLIVSHAAGVGVNTDPDDLNNYLKPEVVRALIMIRAAMFLQGYSGVRPELVRAQVELLNHNITPLIPIKGSVGSSGDLAPLAHLALILLGEGRALVDGRIVSGQEALKIAGLEAFEPTYKEGLALTNGTTASLAVALFALEDARKLLLTADILSAMGLEAILGPTRALEPFVHKLRPHPGQILSAQNMRRVLAGSQLVNGSGEVQALYSLRCSPQVHGCAHEAYRYAREVLTRELNSVTDNPLFDPDLDVKDTLDGGQLCAFNAFSAGNFHGQPIGFAMDFLGMAMAEIANISERRIQMLLDSNHNGDLPQDLIADHGLNSGFMILQYSAAALVSENKVLAHPASVDSIPTSSNAEDHVAMCPHAARKAGEINNNAFTVLGIELLAVVQALSLRTERAVWRDDFGLKPKQFYDHQLGAGSRRAFQLALSRLGDEGEEFKPFERDDRVPARYARRARAVLEDSFADDVNPATEGLGLLKTQAH